MADYSGYKRPAEDAMGGPHKRQRNEGPSRVIFLRGLPQDTTDAEIFEVCGPFGTLTNVLKLPQRNHAFIEYDHLESAQAFVMQCNGACLLRGQVCAVSWLVVDPVVNACKLWPFVWSKKMAIVCTMECLRIVSLNTRKYFRLRLSQLNIFQ